MKSKANKRREGVDHSLRGELARCNVLPCPSCSSTSLLTHKASWRCVPFTLVVQLQLGHGEHYTVVTSTIRLRHKTLAQNAFQYWALSASLTWLYARHGKKGGSLPMAISCSGFREKQICCTDVSHINSSKQHSLHECSRYHYSVHVRSYCFRFYLLQYSQTDELALPLMK